MVCPSPPINSLISTCLEPTLFWELTGLLRYVRWRFCPQGEGEGTHIQDGGSWEILINAMRQVQIKGCGHSKGEGMTSKA